MVIGEGFFLRDGHMPAAQIVKEGARVANAAEGKERPGADFTKVFLVRVGSKPSKAKQSRLRIKDGEGVSIASFNSGSLKFSRHHQDISPAAGSKGLAQRASREQPLVL